MLEKNVYYAATCDLWTSRAHKSYLAVTLHYIDSNWNLCSFVPAVASLNEAHNGTNISTLLSSILKEWEVSEAIIALVTDNGSSMLAAAKQLKYPSISCSAHTLNLVVKKSILHVEPLLEKCRRIVSHFNHSTQATERLRKIQKLYGDKEITVIQDVSTRWNSTYLMLKRFSKLKRALVSYLSANSVMEEFNLSNDEWKRLDYVVELLEPFHTVTELLSSSKRPTLTFFFPLLRSLFVHLAEDKWKHSNTVNQVRDLLRLELAERWPFRDQR